MKKVKKIFNFIFFSLANGFLYLTLKVQKVCANGGISISKKGQDVKGITDITNVLRTGCEACGSLMMVWGVLKLAYGFSSDNPQEMGKATTTLVGGGLLANMSWFLKDDNSATQNGIDITSITDIAKATVKTVGIIMSVIGVSKIAIGFAQDNTNEVSQGIKILIAGVLTTMITFIASLFGVSM